MIASVVPALTALEEKLGREVQGRIGSRLGVSSGRPPGGVAATAPFDSDRGSLARAARCVAYIIWTVMLNAHSCVAHSVAHTCFFYMHVSLFLWRLFQGQLESL